MKIPALVVLIYECYCGGKLSLIVLCKLVNFMINLYMCITHQSHFSHCYAL